MADILPDGADDGAREWPAGSLLPGTGGVRNWAWRTLQAAKEELQMAVESVMEDLEGLGTTSCSQAKESHGTSPVRGSPLVIASKRVLSTTFRTCAGDGLRGIVLFVLHQRRGVNTSA